MLERVVPWLAVAAALALVSTGGLALADGEPRPASPTPPGPAVVRVAGPGGLSYAVPGPRWTTVAGPVSYRDAGGRAVLRLHGVAALDEGYCAATAWSARAVAGFVRGRSPADAARALRRALDGVPEGRRRGTVRLAGGVVAGHEGGTVRLRERGACLPARVTYDVVALPTGGGPVWVLLRDHGPRGPAAREAADVLASVSSSG